MSVENGAEQGDHRCCISGRFEAGRRATLVPRHTRWREAAARSQKQAVALVVARGLVMGRGTQRRSHANNGLVRMGGHECSSVI